MERERVNLGREREKWYSKKNESGEENEVFIFTVYSNNRWMDEA